MPDVSVHVISDRKKIAFEFVSDTSKQLTAVAAALVGLGITFRQDLLKGVTDVPALLQLTVLAYVLTVIAGFAVLMAVTGVLGHEPVPESKEQKDAREAKHGKDPNANAISDDELTIYRAGIRLYFFLQLIFFFGAVLGTFAFGWTRFGVPPKAAQRPAFGFARAELFTGMRCVLTDASDARAAACARRSADVAFRYAPPPAEAAPLIDALTAAATAADSAKPAKRGKTAPVPTPARAKLVDAYMQLDSLMASAKFDSAAAAP
jgi:hypothetical protein